jgi:hypothetical protein
LDLLKSPNLGSWGFPLASTELELFPIDFRLPEVGPRSKLKPSEDPLEFICSGMILDEFEVNPGDFKEGGGDFKQVDTDKLE